jgi:rubrerythrin
MSLHVGYSCDRCDFTFLGGHSDCSSSSLRVFEFRAICKDCLTSFPVFSEDLGYLQANKPCFLHPKSLFVVPRKRKKLEQREWSRRIKRADKAEKQKLRLEWEQLENLETQNIMIDEVKLGTPIQVTESNGVIHLELDTIHCPICESVGKIVLGFMPDEVCPKCTQGYISCCL